MNQYDNLIKEAADTHGVDAKLLKRMVQAESNFDPQARSPKGAMGLMQLMPGTARDLGVEDPFDARQNVMGGAKYLRAMLDKFGDEKLAVAAYNAGPGRVEKAGGVPRISETMNYVAKVLGGGLKTLAGGLGVREAFAGDDDDQVARKYLKRKETVPSREETAAHLRRLAGLPPEVVTGTSGDQGATMTAPEGKSSQAGDLAGQDGENMRVAMGNAIPTTGTGKPSDLTRQNIKSFFPEDKEYYQNLKKLGIPHPAEEALQQPWIDPTNVVAGFGTGVIKGGLGVALRSLLGNALGETVGGVAGEVLSEQEKPGWAWVAALAVDLATGMATDKALGLATNRLRRARPEVTEAQAKKIVSEAAESPEVKEALGPIKQAQPETLEAIKTTIETADPAIKRIQNVLTETIKTDPEVFQFKQNSEAETGAGLALGDVKKWDDRLSGVLTLWRSPEGELYVVNGHQRLALAKKYGVKEIRAQILDSAEYTKEQARSLGALINISEGRGTAVDMAKHMRDTNSTPEVLAEQGISLSETKTQQAVALKNLADPIFQDVALGKLSAEKAAVIGQILPDNQAAQEALYTFLRRAEDRGQSVSIEKLKELARLGREAGQTSKQQMTLFGEEEMKKSLLMEQADLLAYAKKRLRSDEKLFGTAAREKGRLEEAGNLIDPDTNQAISEEAAKALFMLDKTVYVADTQTNGLLKEFSRRLAEWKNKSEVRTEFYARLKEALKTDTETIVGLDFGLGSLMKQVRGAFGRTGKVWKVMEQAEGMDKQPPTMKISDKEVDRIVTPGPGDREKIRAWLRGEINPDEWEMPVHINWDRIEAPEDVEKILADLAKLEAEEFQAAGRGVRGHEVTETTARLHGMTVEELAQRQKGTAFNAEQVLRSQQIAVSAVTELERRSAALKALGDAATPQDMEDYFRFFKLTSHLAAQARGGLTETARGLEAAKIARKAQPGLTEKVAELDAFARGVWGPQDAAEIADYMGRLESPRQAVSFLRSVGKAVEKGADILYHYWINALLSGPKTLVANITGMVNVPAHIMERAVAAKISGGVAEGEAAAMVYGAFQGFKDGLRLAGKALKTGESPYPWSSRLDIPAEKKNPLSSPNLGLDPGSMLGRAVDLMGEIISFPTKRVMNAIDALGGSVGMRMELNALAYRQAWKEGLQGEDMARRIREILDNPGQYEFIYEQGLNMAKAVNYANDLGPLGQKVQKVFSYGPLKWVGPFIRAGGNLANFVIDRSPLGLVTRKFWSDLQSPQAAVRDLALARFGLGSALMGLGTYLASEGWITGSGPKDPALRATWEQTGWQANSAFNPITQKYVSFNRSDPLGMQLGLAADMFEISHHLNADELDRAFFYTVTSLGRQLTSKSYLRGVSDLLDAWEDPEHKGGRYWRNFAGSFIPTIVKDVARLQEPGPREVGTGIEGFVNTLKSRIPGFTREVQPQLDFWAEPKVMEGSWPGAIYDFFLPFYVGKEGGDKVDHELMRLGFPLRKPGNVIETGGMLRDPGGGRDVEAVRLNPEQYNRYLEISRKAVGSKSLKEAVGDIMGSSAYQSRPDEIKALVIKDVVNRYQQAAKAKLFQEFPDLKDQVVSTKMLKKGAQQ